MVIGRAILDERLLDLPLNALFWDLILELPVHLEDLKKVDQQLAQTMLAFQEIVNKKKDIENDKNLSVALKKELIERLTFNVYFETMKELNFYYREHLWILWASISLFLDSKAFFCFKMAAKKLFQ